MQLSVNPDWFIYILVHLLFSLRENRRLARFWVSAYSDIKMQSSYTKCVNVGRSHIIILNKFQYIYIFLHFPSYPSPCNPYHSSNASGLLSSQTVYSVHFEQHINPCTCTTPAVNTLFKLPTYLSPFDINSCDKGCVHFSKYCLKSVTA